MNYINQVCAGAAVEPQRGARRRGDGLQPLPQPRHGGQAEEARHRVHQVNSSVIEAEFVMSAVMIVIKDTYKSFR